MELISQIDVIAQGMLEATETLALVVLAVGAIAASGACVFLLGIRLFKRGAR